MMFSKTKFVAFASSPQGIFAIIVVFFGLLFLIITPPFQEPDGYEHFMRISFSRRYLWMVGLFSAFALVVALRVLLTRYYAI